MDYLESKHSLDGQEFVIAAYVQSDAERLTEDREKFARGGACFHRRFRNESGYGTGIICQCCGAKGNRQLDGVIGW